MGNPVVHFDISGPDPEELQKFYGRLFGWQVTAIPGMSYALVDTQAGSGVNGGIGLAREGAGIVAFYVMCDDLQATLDRAESLGGKTTQPVTTIPGAVTLAMLADPEGHEVGLIGGGDQMQTQQGAPSPGSGAPVSWFEVSGPDGAGLVSFYCELFGWTAKQYQIPGTDYWEIDTGSDVGIKGGIGTGGEGQSYATVYAVPADLEATLAEATQLGATTVIPPMPIPNGPTIAMIADPQGHLFGVFRP